MVGCVVGCVVFLSRAHLTKRRLQERRVPLLEGYSVCGKGESPESGESRESGESVDEFQNRRS